MFLQIHFDQLPRQLVESGRRWTGEADRVRRCSQVTDIESVSERHWRMWMTEQAELPRAGALVISSAGPQVELVEGEWRRTGQVDNPFGRKASHIGWCQGSY